LYSFAFSALEFLQKTFVNFTR